MKFLYILIMSSLILAGCSSTNQAAPSKELNQEGDVSQNPEITKEYPFLTGAHFEGDEKGFVIKDFAITYDKDKNEIVFNNIYTFGDKSRQYLLSGDHDYYIYVSIPERLTTYFTETETDPVKGPSLVEGENAQYQVELRASLKNGISNQIIESILKEPLGFSITVYEDPEYPAKRIIGVYDFHE